MNSKFNQEKGPFPDSQKGFTLLEVLVAIVILSVALLGMATLTGSIVHYNQFASEITGAATLAQDKMEELKNTSYSGINDSTETIDIDNITYTRTSTVTTDSPAAGMKTIVVQVTWDWQGQTRNVVLNTIIAE